MTKGQTISDLFKNNKRLLEDVGVKETESLEVIVFKLVEALKRERASFVISKDAVLGLNESRFEDDFTENDKENTQKNYNHSSEQDGIIEQNNHFILDFDAHPDSSSIQQSRHLKTSASECCLKNLCKLDKESDHETATETRMSYIKENSTQTFAYEVSVRGSKRKSLDATTCTDCESYYSSTNSLNSSRHRFLHKRPGTPTGYWDTSFE